MLGLLIMGILAALDASQGQGSPAPLPQTPPQSQPNFDWTLGSGSAGIAQNITPGSIIQGGPAPVAVPNQVGGGSIYVSPQNQVTVIGLGLGGLGVSPSTVTPLAQPQKMPASGTNISSVSTGPTKPVVLPVSSNNSKVGMMLI